MNLQEDGATIDKEEDGTTIDQENGTTIDQEDVTTIDQEDDTTIDQENGTTIDQEDGTTIDQEEDEYEVARARNLKLQYTNSDRFRQKFNPPKGFRVQEGRRSRRAKYFKSYRKF